MRKALFLQLAAVFIATQLIGLTVAGVLIQENIKATIVTENPEDIVNAIALIAYILVFTAFLLVFIRFFKGRALFKLLEALAIFSTSFIVFAVFVPDVAFMLAVLLVALRNSAADNILARNFSAIIAIAGAGAVIGVSIGVIPALVFIALLSLYDIIAVFKTKHMVTMAKSITKRNLAFTVAFPTKEHRFELGTGDLVIPLVFAVAVLNATKEYALPALILGGSLIGLLLTVNYSAKHVGKALPALPLQTVLMVAVWAAGAALL